MKRVICCTDRPLLAMGLRALLKERSEFELSASCSTLTEVVAAAHRLQPHVLLYALNFDPAAIALLCPALPFTPVVVWDRDLTAEQAHHAVGLGVRAFLCPTASLDSVHDCLRLASEGGTFVHASLASSMATTKPMLLSKRQTQILGLLVQGLKNKEIAGLLEISEHTVKSYLTVLFEKAGVKDRFELALFGLKHMGGLLDPPIAKAALIGTDDRIAKGGRNQSPALSASRRAG